MYDEKRFKKYLNKVENFFIEKRGTPFILSSEDVQLILYWFKKGVPEKIIENGIEIIFERLKEKGDEKKINSIKYCAQKIEELFKEEEKRASRSWHTKGEEIDIVFSLNKVKEAISSFFENKTEYKKQKENFLKKIEKLKNLENLDEIEDNLKKIEEKIIELYYKKIIQEEKEKQKKEIEKNLPEEVRNLPVLVKNSIIKMIFFEKIKKEKNIPTISLLL